MYQMKKIHSFIMLKNHTKC